MEVIKESLDSVTIKKTVELLMDKLKGLNLSKPPLEQPQLTILIQCFRTTLVNNLWKVKSSYYPGISIPPQPNNESKFNIEIESDRLGTVYIGFVFSPERITIYFPEKDKPSNAPQWDELMLSELQSDPKKFQKKLVDILEYSIECANKDKRK